MMIIAGKLAYYCTKNEELQLPAGTRIFQKSACYTLISTFLINMAYCLKKVFNICGNGQSKFAGDVACVFSWHLSFGLHVCQWNRCWTEGYLFCFKSRQHSPLEYLFFTRKLGKGKVILSNSLCILELFAQVKSLFEFLVCLFCFIAYLVPLISCSFISSE